MVKTRAKPSVSDNLIARTRISRFGRPVRLFCALCYQWKPRPLTFRCLLDYCSRKLYYHPKLTKSRLATQWQIVTYIGGRVMSVDLGILFIRVLFGVAIAAHGAQKLFGWFGGYGIKGTGGFFESIGFRPGTTLAALAGLSEFAGGVLLILGLFTPFAAAAVVATMIVAL